ncbi:MAG TPA: ergothioneine biosynthesis protein EgtB [Miltoncostaeaceae bacterium]|nr:ergothioneine biosynthesis protein EgtB [Miltoncostaeaceae bacterium]
MATTWRRPLAADPLLAELERARGVTTSVVGGLTDEQLTGQISPLMSPLAWDLAHIAHYEELWLLRDGGRLPAEGDPRFDDLYDAFAHGRAERAALPLLGAAEAFAFMDDVRERVRARLAAADAGERAALPVPLVVQHELQHVETMLQTLQLSGWYLPTPPHLDDIPAGGSEPVLVPAGPATLGTDDARVTYDNERPAHRVWLEAFRIERYPVSNARYMEFIADGGYRRPGLWTPEGWTWRIAEGAEAPLYWRREGAVWVRRRFGVDEVPPAAEPVQHVSFHEAEAFARWAGRRLPTEAEWERAAAGWRAGPDDVLGVRHFGPRPTRPRPGAPVARGMRAALGGVWEWTSSHFGPYPGFRAHPYPEYSEVFFGDRYRVLRGGSWATDPAVARVTFRNWDLPERRQIFAGIRLAEDA